MRICGKANEVFKAIQHISEISPDMTLEEVSQGLLLSQDIKKTQPFEIGKYPNVYINEAYGKN